MKRFSSAVFDAASKPTRKGDRHVLLRKMSQSPAVLQLLFVAAFTLASVQVSRADVFGSGTSSFEIELVTIGNPSGSSV